ncbi:MAG: hypothetical protein J0H99_14160 [Rhodospirillales bacterium]|nr:hypothetical protein [Rhodospirillales bacterium]
MTTITTMRVDAAITTLTRGMVIITASAVSAMRFQLESTEAARVCRLRSDRVA